MDLHQCCRCSRNIAEVTSKIIYFYYQKYIFTGSKYNTCFCCWKNFIALHQRYIVCSQLHGKTSLFTVVTRYIRSYCIICVWYALLMLLFPLLTIVLMMSFTHTHTSCTLSDPTPTTHDTKPIKSVVWLCDKSYMVWQAQTGLTTIKWSDNYKLLCQV